MDNEQDERIVCPHCGKKITPRLSFYSGTPNGSWCPFCKGRVDEDGALLGIAVVVAIIVGLYFYLSG